MPICEGCGTRADETHIRHRAERLRLASSYRPLQVKVLFLDAAPPARPEDYFYQPAADRTVRSLTSCMYFDELVKTMGVFPSAALQEDVTLGEFKRRSFFLMYALECPFEVQDNMQNAMRRFAPSAMKRVQALYQPSYIVPLSEQTNDLVRLFGLIGWGDRLILDNGRPFVDPYLGDRKKQAAFNSGFGDRVRNALSNLP
jgi:hypothetical protein